VTGGLRVGVADHLGWAVAVTATTEHHVVDRRRIELVEPGVTPAPIHYERQGLDLDQLGALVEEVRTSVVRATSASLGTLAAAVGAPILSLAVRAWPVEVPRDLADQHRPPWEARVDGVMYREILTEVAEARGWQVHHYDARHVLGEARDVLGARADEVLQGPRARLGAPWTKDHRVALAATVVAG
jgi:hypothetical protein